MRSRASRGYRTDSTKFLLESETHDSSHSNWAISYGDMVTLLLSFFVLFFGVREQSKLQKFQKSIEQKAGGAGLGAAGTAASTATGTTTAATTATAPGTGTGTGLGSGTKAGSSIPIDKVDQAWKRLRMLDGARLVKDQQRLVIEYPEIAFFKFNRTELTNEGKAELRSFAELFTPFQADLKLIVIGYTDNVPVKISKKKNKVYRYTDNLELSALRGVSAVRELIVLGVNGERIRVGGEGEWKGQNQAEVAADWKSRRVVLVIESEEGAKR